MNAIDATNPINPTSSINAFIKIGIIALLIFTPLAFGSVEIWAKAVLQIMAFMLLAVWLIRYGFVREAIPVRIPWGPLGMALLFMGWVLLQQATSSSVNPHGTRGALILGMAYAAVFGLVIVAVRTEREIKHLVQVLILIGFGVALLAILQKYTWNGKIYWLREIREGMAYGPFVNRNHLAGYMAMLIPLGMGYIVSQFILIRVRGRTAWNRFIARLTDPQSNRLALILFLVLVMSVALVLSLSRTGILSFLTAMLVLGMVLSLGRITHRWALLPGVLLALVLISLTWFGLGPVFDRLRTLLHVAEDPSMIGRIEVFKDTLRLVSDYPIMGTGLGTFGVAYPAYKTLPDQISYAHAHNDYVQLLAETGWVGFALGMGILFLFLSVIIRGWLCRRNPWARVMLMGVFAGILSPLIHGLTDFNFHIPSNALLFTIFLGLAWNLSHPDRPEAVPDPAAGWWWRAGAVGGLIVAGWVLYAAATGWVADHHYRSGLEWEITDRYEAAAQEYRQAIDWDSADPRYHFALAKIHERDWVGGAGGSSLQSAEEELSIAITQAPTVAEYHLHMGWVYAQQRQHEKASAEFSEVLRLAPTNANWRHYVGLWFAAVGGRGKGVGG